MSFVERGRKAKRSVHEFAECEEVARDDRAEIA
jgi:hypothetical protein